MSNKDVFADLFASSTKKGDLSKLTLAERSKISSKTTNNTQNAFAGLDFLTTSSSTSSMNLNTGVTGNNSSVGLTEEPFSSMLPTQRIISVNSSSSSIPMSSSPILNNNITNNTNDYIKTNCQKGSQDLDVLFSVFDNPHPPSATPSSAPSTAGLCRSGSADVKTSIPPNNPHRPYTSKFQDNSMIGYGPASTSSHSMPFQGNHSNHKTPLTNHSSKDSPLPLSSPLPQPPIRPRNVRNLFDDLNTATFHTNNNNNNADLVADTAAELFSSATMLFNKGKQALNKNIEKYQAQRSAERSGNPAWMYYNSTEKRNGANNGRHRSSGNEWDMDVDFDEEEVVDFDGSVLHSDKSKQSTTNPQDDHELASTLPTQPERKKEGLLHPKSVSRAKQEDAGSIQPVSEASQLINLFDDFSVSFPQQSQNPTSRNNTIISGYDHSQNPISTSTALDNAALTSFNSFKKSGGEFFKEGNFTEALGFYQKAQVCSAQDSRIQLLAFSNLCTTYMKLGDTSNVILNADKALELINNGEIFNNGTAGNKDLEKVIIPESNGKTAKEFFVKIHAKKAEAYEVNDKYKLALKEWKTVLENGGANKNSIDGKRRCLEALGQIKKPLVAPPKQIKRLRTSANSEAVQRVKENSKEQERLEQEKYVLYDTVERKINSWKNGKEDNIRALLVSLDEILWAEMNWKPVKLNDLIIDKKVRVYYMKAVAKTHPDKMGKNFSTEQQLVAQQVFVTLNKAWDLFKEQNGMN